VSIHTTGLATELMNYDALLVELEELERREKEVSAQRRKLHDRLDTFPNDVAREQELAVSAERKELHRRITEVRAKLETLARGRDGRA
jgi:hypothetical protein